MSAPVAGPFRIALLDGSMGDLDARLPSPNSLRRASDESKVAVIAAADAIRGAGLPVTERTGLYVGQQQVSLDYCQKFVDQSYKDGPRMASPMLFADSVANSVATHLSLTLGFKGSAQTFIGTRAAGIQAALAAAEDLACGAVDQALVVVLGTGTDLTAAGYHAAYRPGARRPGPPAFPMTRGAAAFALRPEAAGLPRLLGGGLCCAGRDEGRQRRAVEALAAGAPKGGREIASVFRLSRERSLRILRMEGGDEKPEAFALDPFLRLAEDAARAPGSGLRVAWVLGEEGTAGWLAFDGALPVQV